MPTKNIDKLIVTNRSLMKAKYGAAYKDVCDAVDQLIVADKARGVETLFVEIDLATPMKKHKAKAVSDGQDEKQCKTAIDALHKALAPAYLMILGAADVVPQQRLTNPTNDEDPRVPSDLPYACEAPYSLTVSKFLGPTRVVGRLPDLTGATDPAYLIALLGNAAKWKSSPRSQYEKYFGLTAKVWRGSTKLSLENLFGDAAKLKNSPPDGPNWTSAQLKAPSHFINCHGDTPDNQFYGQSGRSFPVAMRAEQIDGKIAIGTVAAVECCFGAELYDPALTDGQPGIFHVYLGNGAYGFFGSSNIAYGPSDGNGAADLVCQNYLKYLLSGSSSGRAALQARQEFVGSIADLDPIDLKTLAQFSLMGDPSIHPVANPTPHLLMAKTKKLRSLAVELSERMIGRDSRRRKLASRGLSLVKMASYACKRRQLEPSKQTENVLLDLAKQAKIKVETIVSYQLAGGLQPKSMRSALGGPAKYFVVAGQPGESPLNRIVFVAKEQSGELIGVRELHRR